MARLLIVHHTPSPSLDAMFRSVIDGTGAEGIDGVEVVARPALVASSTDVLEADGIILGTPANLGYMSGALKHFFDTIYYPCLEATRNLPFCCYVHGNNDVDGALLGIERIVTGLEWKQVGAHARSLGDPTAADLEDCWELGATIAATVAEASSSS